MDCNISSPTFFTSLKESYIFVVIVLDEDRVSERSFRLIFRKVLCEEFSTMVNVVYFAMGMLADVYVFWFDAVRGIRDWGRGMCF
jgi:hypothetical protein